MTYSYHLCLDVRGALLNWSDRELATVLKHDDGRRMTAREAKLALMDEIAKGHCVIPVGECDAFDYQTGCRGHEVASDQAVAHESVPPLATETAEQDSTTLNKKGTA